MAVNGILNNALSGLIASRQAMNTVSHNVSNVNTPGYSRQRTELTTRSAFILGGLNSGNGVVVDGVRRIYDTTLQQQIRSSSSSLQHYESLAALASGVDSLLTESSSGMASNIQAFFDAASSVNNNPSSVIERGLLLDSGRAVLNRSQALYAGLEEIRNGTNSRLTNTVETVNQLATNLAQVNGAIGRAGVLGRGTPNDLLDKRDQLVQELSAKIDLSSTQLADGTVNIYIGKGESLVTGDKTRSLRAGKNTFDGRLLEVEISDGVGFHSISSSINNGELYGILQFRKEVLDPATNGLGRVIASLGLNINAQNRLGQDLNGNLGSDFFTVGAPEVLPKNTNASLAATAVPVVGFADASLLTTDNYVLSWKNSAWQLSNQRTGQPVTMTGAGTLANPFLADGLSISVAGITAVAADRYDFLIRPTAVISRDTTLAITDPSTIAAALPLRATTAAANLGTMNVGNLINTSVAGLPLGSPAGTITLTYSPNALGAGIPGFAVTGGPGGTLAYNPATESAGKTLTLGGAYSGVSFQVSGVPQTGDLLTVADNTGGVSDNGNMLKMAGLVTRGVLDGGNHSILNAYGQTVSKAGSATHQANINRDAQQSLYDFTMQSRESLSGVNLDEEAANLLKFQQTYQAASRVVAVSNSMFNQLINAIGG